MPFKPDYSYKLGKRSNMRGRLTDIIIDQYQFNEKKKIENEKLEEERNRRKKLYSSIIKKISQNWADEEILKAVEQEFPTEGRAKILNLINYWRNQQKKYFGEIDKLLEKVLTGKISLSQANMVMKTKCSNARFYKELGYGYYSRKVETLGDEER